MKKYIMAVGISILSCKSYALGLNSGIDVLNSCQTAEEFLAGKNTNSRDSEACVHFLMGFDSGQSVAALTAGQKALYCQPKGSNIKSMVSSVVSGLKNDKTYYDAPAGVAVWKALAAAWPCKSN
jgi:hypothetical protein